MRVWFAPCSLQTSPFLVRTFVKIGGFHRLTLFEDGTLPTTDEQQIFTWYVYFKYFRTTVLTVGTGQQTGRMQPFANY